MRLGIDVSNNNGLIDWPLVGASGITLAMVKVSEGTPFVDSIARRNIDGALQAGMMVGGYHFARPSVNGAIAEANWFGRCLAHLPPLTLLAGDFEDDKVQPGANLAAWATDWLEEVDSITGHTPRLYSSVGYILAHQLDDITAAATYPLWLAAWTNHEPTSPAPWIRVNGWQFAAEVTWPGISRVDLSLWDYQPA